MNLEHPTPEDWGSTPLGVRRRLAMEDYVVRSGAYVPISTQLLVDLPGYEHLTPDVSAYMSPFPHLVLFPRSTRLAATARLARQRAREAWGVLRHGLPEEDW